MQNKTQPYLSVIIPSYNEAQNIKRGVLDQVLSYLSEQKYDWELILSDDGSSDGTLDTLREFAQKNARIKVLANKHKGKAPTVTAGMLSATGKWRLFTDFDQSTPLSEIEKLLEYSQKGFDVVIGSREIMGARRDDEPFYRHVMGRGFNIIVQILAVQGVLDTQCGFKLFSQEACQDLFSKLVVYSSSKERSDAFTGAFDVELLFLAHRLGYLIKEVPVIWIHNETDRVSPVKDSLRMLFDVMRIRFASWSGKYPEKKL